MPTFSSIFAGGLHKGDAITSALVGLLGVLFVLLSDVKRRSYQQEHEYVDEDDSVDETKDESRGMVFGLFWYAVCFVAVSALTYLIISRLIRPDGSSASLPSYGGGGGGGRHNENILENGALDDILRNVSREEAGF